MTEDQKTLRARYKAAKAEWDRLSAKEDAIIKKATAEIKPRLDAAYDALDAIRNELPEDVGTCEHCDEPIFESDLYAPGGDVMLCHEHAPMLSDVIEYLEGIVAEGDGDESRNHEDAVADLASCRDDLAKNGDRKAVYTA